MPEREGLPASESPIGVDDLVEVDPDSVPGLISGDDFEPHHQTRRRLENLPCLFEQCAAHVPDGSKPSEVSRLVGSLVLGEDPLHDAIGLI